jgi:hypothetical protein
VGAQEGATWDEIGHRIEFQVKSGLGNWAGASPEDDWTTVGNKIGAKIEKVIDETINSLKKEGKPPEPPQPPKAEGA